MSKKQPTYPNATKALQYYEAALSTLQQLVSKLDTDTIETIQRRWHEAAVPPIPGAQPFQLAIHDAGDAFRVVKELLDPDRPLPSTKNPELP